jgi:hypothetical protein
MSGDTKKDAHGFITLIDFIESPSLCNANIIFEQ